MVRALPPPSEFVSFVEENLGLHAEAPGSASWAEILQQRLDATHRPTFEKYRQRFASAATRREEVAQLARVLTVGETYFFRDSRQFEALSTVVLPSLLHRRAVEREVHVLSVACSTGEEPYSVAIAARELLGVRADRIQIHAFDANPVAIASAERAEYSEWSLRATPAGLKSRYFTRRGNLYALPNTITSAVTFEVRNLFEEDPEFFRQGRFDVILFRNALIYFSRRKIEVALKRLTDILAQDGVLFLGNAETPRTFEERLVPQEICGSFCYRISEDSAPKSRQPSPSTEVRSVGEAVTYPSLENVAVNVESTLTSDAWVTAIDAATRRLAALVPSVPADTPVRPVAKTESERDTRLDEARELIARERFGEALTKLDDLVATGNRSNHVDLLRASILTNQGRFVESCDVCRRLLTEEPHSAGAYHLLGVASEQLGRLGEARHCYQTAITLEPSFAMTHWLLGRLCLRTEHREEARRHLTDALELWRLEGAPSTVMSNLYTGGFERNAFMNLCRADLARCEVIR